MVDATIGFAVERLSYFLSDQVNTRRGVRNGLRWLREELGYLQSSVRDAESRQQMDHLISQWIENVRDVANDVVLILDLFSVLKEDHAASKRGALDRVRNLCKKEANLYRIGKKIRSLKERTVEIKNRRNEYGINNLSTTSMVIQRKRTLLRATSFENHVDVVGFEDDVKTLLSGLLLHKKSYEDWSKVKDHFWRQLKGDSVEIQEILSLSYYDLSFKIRQCFLYIARYPEDCTFRVGELMQLWIAEEFIVEAEGDGVVVEDVAEDYLHELINRNMIQIALLQLNGQVRKCRVHDLVRDLAIEKANEDKLLVVLDLSKDNPSHIHLLQGQPRHAIYDETGKYLHLLETSSDDLKLRSLTLTNETTPILEEIKSMYTRFKYLKVLDLTRVRSTRIPKVMGNEVLLKFLGLPGQNDSRTPLVIPSTISKLKRLQTLRGPRFSVYIVPRVIWELKDLRHLVLKFFYCRRAIEFFHIRSHQKKLQTLGSIWFDDWMRIDTVNLTSLRSLVILSNESSQEYAYTLDSLSNLSSLHTFIVKCNAIPTIKPLSFCKRLKKVYLLGTMKDPSELNFLPNSVTHLTLVRSEFIQDPMPALESFSNLIGLDMNNVYMGDKMVCSQDAFPSLQYLNLEDIPCLEEWKVEDGTLPSKGLT